MTTASPSEPEARTTATAGPMTNRHLASGEDPETIWAMLADRGIDLAAVRILLHEAMNEGSHDHRRPAGPPSPWPTPRQGTPPTGGTRAAYEPRGTARKRP